MRCYLLDDDLVGFMLEHELGTPSQTLRWLERVPELDDEDADEE